MLKQIIVALSLSALSLPAFAAGYATGAQGPVAYEKQVQLKDGQTLYILKDGRMAVADKWGRPASVAAGATLESLDGQRFTITHNEVQLIDAVHYHPAVP